MLKMRKIEKSSGGGTYAQSFINLKTYCFLMKKKQQNSFSTRERMPQFLTIFFHFKFFSAFFVGDFFPQSCKFRTIICI